MNMIKKRKNKKGGEGIIKHMIDGEIVELKDMKDEDFFDDCPVCQAMKFARDHGRMPSLSEMRKAFQKAKDQGAIVGGEWFEKNNKSKS